MSLGYYARKKSYGKVLPEDCTPKQRRRLRKKGNQALKRSRIRQELVVASEAAILL